MGAAAKKTRKKKATKKKKVLKPQDYATDLRDGWNDQLLTAERNKARWAPKNVYASQYTPCDRAQALNLVRWDARPPFESDALNRMHLGNEMEAYSIHRLNEIGRRFSKIPFEVVGQQERFEIRDTPARGGEVLITGKYDVRILWKGDTTRRGRPFEIKHGDAVRNCETLDDMWRSPWTRRMPYQLLSYLYSAGEEWGGFLIPKPTHLHPIVVELEPNLELVQRFINQAQVAMKARAEWLRYQELPEHTGDDDAALLDRILPPFHQDPVECGRCNHFNRSCTPDLQFGEGAHVLPAHLEEALVRIDSNKKAASQYTKDRNMVRDAVRGKPICLAGKYHVTGSWSPRKQVVLSDKMKARYTQVKEQGTWNWKHKDVTKRKT